jgi:hypothetical protein
MSMPSASVRIESSTRRGRGVNAGTVRACRARDTLISAAPAHAGVLKIFDFERSDARLVAEGRTAPDSDWLFQRWRFNER